MIIKITVNPYSGFSVSQALLYMVHQSSVQVLTETPSQTNRLHFLSIALVEGASEVIQQENCSSTRGNRRYF